MNSLSIFGLIFAGVAVAYSGLALFFDGYERGHKLGRQEGYQEGFGAAREIVESCGDVGDWWGMAEREVRETQEKLRDEERWP